MPVDTKSAFSRLMRLSRIAPAALFLYTFNWMILALILGSLAGTASAFFLLSLDWATSWRESHSWIILGLPAAGLVIGLMYHYWGKEVVKGNNQLIEEIQKPRKVIPLIMAPLVYAGTIITHLFGGSAGREGTAVQMGGAFADQLTRPFKLRPRDRKVLIICGMSAGFASVFGTPLAGALFGLEVFVLGRMMYGAILPSFLSAVAADLVCKAWGVYHVSYDIAEVPEVNAILLFVTLLAGVLFGLAAKTFSFLTHALGDLFSRYITFPPFRPVIGGIALVVLLLMAGNEFAGLGVPTIAASFHQQQLWYVFLVKMLLTALTLGSGFKGGEVTPLFFIGAALGSALSGVLPLPVGLLAGMGFVAVFAGAANTPITCVLLSIELFGVESSVFVTLAIIIAYLFSGHNGIYQAQMIGEAKHGLYARLRGRSLGNIRQGYR